MRVDYRNNVHDKMVVMLGAMGFGTDFIAAQSKLSPGQVIYRLGKAGVKRSDFRNGTSRVAKLVLRATSHTIEQRLDYYYNLRRLNAPEKA